MKVDVDDFLDQTDHDFARGHSQNMHDTVQNTFEPDSFNVHDSYDNNLGCDVFSSNNSHGGQGSLSFVNSREQQQFYAPPVLDDHWSAQNSQQYHEQYQAVVPSGFGSHSSHHLAQHGQDSSAGRMKDVADSIEYENSAPEDEEEEDEVLLKNEERDSDDEFEEDDDDNEGDEEAEDGQKKRNKRKPYSGPRSLIRWHTGKDQLALMALIYELEMENIKVPYERVCRHIEPGCAAKGDALIQHLTKARRARIYYGLPVPPPSVTKKKTSSDNIDNATEKEIKTWTTLTYTKPGRDDQFDDTPGSMPPHYTPLPIPGRPDLPHFDPVTGTEVNMPRSRAETPAKAPRATQTAGPPGKKKGKQAPKEDTNKEESAPAVSIEKKGRSSRKVVKTEEDDDANYNEKPTRKGQSTPAASKRKPAAKSTTKATPSKPKGVIKSKKTPATLNKKMSALAMQSPQINLAQAATPSKKPAASKKKAKTNAAPVHEDPAAAEVPPIAINDEEQPGQSYGRVSRDPPGMPTQSLEDMLADLPSDQFQMGRHQASQSFDSQSTMSTVPNQSMFDASAQFAPNNLYLPMQNSFSGNSYLINGYGHQMMPSNNSSFAHGHNVSAMFSDRKEQNNWHSGLQGQGGYLIQQYNNGYSYGNAQSHGPEPRGLGIMNTTALLPREPVQLETDLGNYSFASGPANNIIAQQQLFSNDDAQMQTNDNDIKPNVQYIEGLTDISNFEDSSNIFNDIQ